MNSHQYIVTYTAQTNTWSVLEKKGFPPPNRDRSVNCDWNMDPNLRVYSTVAYGECAGDALNVSQDRILAYIQEHKDPYTTIKEVVDGKATFRSYDEIINELCRAALLQKEEHNGTSNT